jgi:hypothetical protein
MPVAAAAVSNHHREAAARVAVVVARAMAKPVRQEPQTLAAVAAVKAAATQHLRAGQEW